MLEFVESGSSQGVTVRIFIYLYIVKVVKEDDILQNNEVEWKNLCKTTTLCGQNLCGQINSSH